MPFIVEGAALITGTVAPHVATAAAHAATAAASNAASYVAHLPAAAQHALPWAVAHPTAVVHQLVSAVEHSVAWQFGSRAMADPEHIDPGYIAAAGSLTLSTVDPLVAANTAGGVLAGKIWPAVAQHMPDSWQLLFAGSIRLSPEKVLAWIGHEVKSLNQPFSMPNIPEMLTKALGAIDCELVLELVLYESCGTSGPADALARVVGKAWIAQGIAGAERKKLSDTVQAHTSGERAEFVAFEEEKEDSSGNASDCSTKYKKKAKKDETKKKEVFQMSSAAQVSERNTKITTEAGIARAAFESVIKNFHPKLSYAQVDALWTAYSKRTQNATMDHVTFSGILDAVASGGDHICDYVEMSSESFQSLAMTQEAASSSAFLQDSKSKGGEKVPDKRKRSASSSALSPAFEKEDDPSTKQPLQKQEDKAIQGSPPRGPKKISPPTELLNAARALAYAEIKLAKPRKYSLDKFQQLPVFADRIARGALREIYHEALEKVKQEEQL